MISSILFLNYRNLYQKMKIINYISNIVVIQIHFPKSKSLICTVIELIVSSREDIVTSRDETFFWSCSISCFSRSNEVGDHDSFFFFRFLSGVWGISTAKEGCSNSFRCLLQRKWTIFWTGYGSSAEEQKCEPCIRFFWGDPLRHLCSENEISSHQNDHKDHKRKNFGLCPLSVKVIIYIDKGR